jgi:hypothetical protein
MPEVPEVTNNYFPRMVNATHLVKMRKISSLHPTVVAFIGPAGRPTGNAHVKGDEVEALIQAWVSKLIV